MVAPQDRRSGGGHRPRRDLAVPGRPDPGEPGPETARGTGLAHPPGHPGLLAAGRRRLRLAPRSSRWCGGTSIDEKTTIVARARRHTGQAPRPGRVARQEFEYRWHDTLSLVAPMHVRSGEVLTEIITRNNAATFTAFFDRLEAAIDPGNEIHTILDNGSSHTAKHTKSWLAAHSS
ncbi:transposase, partial [Streptomyces sp900116325]|uniref:transposase n=1 Tax=Streptomyces sp. 900116325 TaxID=3154295 RepID=UPI00340245A6